MLVVANRDPRANNPHDRVTLTLPVSPGPGLVVFTVSGPSKREAFAGLVAGADLPCGRVTAGEVLWLVDADAAAGVRSPRVGGTGSAPVSGRTAAPPVRCRRCPPTPAPPREVLLPPVDVAHR